MEEFTIPEFTRPPVTSTNRVDLIPGLRDLRNRLLQENVDSYNPIRYGLLTDEQRAELAAYRLALLNVPQQPTWPTDVVWPTKPSWM